MKEMRLFEIGFKEKLHQTSYEYKFFVGAEKAEVAIAKAREYIVEDPDGWWNYEGDEDEELTPEELAKAKKEIERLKTLPLARVQEIGLLLV